MRLPCRFRYSILLVPLLALTIVVLSACGGSRAADGRTAATADEPSWARENRDVRAVEAVEISLGSFRSFIGGSGRIAGEREATVVAESHGVLQRVEFDLGAVVVQGDLLAAFDDRVERLAMDQARAQAASVRVELDAAQRQFEAGAASRNELARAEAAAAGAAAEYQRAIKRLDERSISAPIGGRIARRDPRVAVGNFLPAGVAVAHIVDTSRLQLELAVGEREITYVEPGARAEIRIDACGGETQIGAVRSVAAGSDPSTGSFAVIVAWDNGCGDRVRSGMSAEVRIEPGRDRELLLVPSSALLRRGGTTIVYVIEDDAAVQREVSIGRRAGNRAEVVAGLTQGELVAVSALSSLSEGDPVSATVIGKSGELR